MLGPCTLILSGGVSSQTSPLVNWQFIARNLKHFSSNIIPNIVHVMHSLAKNDTK